MKMRTRVTPCRSLQYLQWVHLTQISNSVYTGSGGTSVKGPDGPVAVWCSRIFSHVHPPDGTHQPRGSGFHNQVQKEDQSFENRNNAALKVISFHCRELVIGNGSWESWTLADLNQFREVRRPSGRCVL